MYFILYKHWYKYHSSETKSWNLINWPVIPEWIWHEQPLSLSINHSPSRYSAIKLSHPIFSDNFLLWMKVGKIFRMLHIKNLLIDFVTIHLYLSFVNQVDKYSHLVYTFWLLFWVNFFLFTSSLPAQKLRKNIPERSYEIWEGWFRSTFLSVRYAFFRRILF